MSRRQRAKRTIAASLIPGLVLAMLFTWVGPMLAYWRAPAGGKHWSSDAPKSSDGAWWLDLRQGWLWEEWTLTYPASIARLLPLPPPLPREPPAWLSQPSEQARAARAGYYPRHICTTAFGFPFRGTRYEQWFSSYYPPGVPILKGNELIEQTYPGGVRIAPARDRGTPDLVLPLRPIWSGVLGNLVFWWLAAAASAWLAAFTRSALRRRRGSCAACGYSRIGLPPSAACPECGSGGGVALR